MTSAPPSSAPSRDGYVALLGVVVLILAAGLAVKGVKIDSSILILIGIGVVLVAWPALSARLSKLSIGKDGLTVELSDRLAAVESKAASTQANVAQLSNVVTQTDGGGGLDTSAVFNLIGEPADGKTKRGPKDRARAIDPLSGDPLAGKFGGLAARNGRVLKAQVRPYPSSNKWGIVDLRVEPAPGAPLITEPVKFYLHPTFAPNDVQSINPNSSGTASLEVTSYGAFTVGAEADGGRTQLELNLAKAEGAFSPWKER